MANNLIKISGNDFIVDLMYAKKDNISGRAIYQEIGFGNQALVHPDVWECLLKTIPILRKYGLKMKICDAYRPPLAHLKFLEALPQEGLFARSPELSQHCHGTAVDVLLMDENGHDLIYPTAVDGYSPEFAKELQSGNIDGFFKYLKKARHDYTKADEVALKNRQFLCDLMTKSGFEPLMHEWWHYNLPNGKDDHHPMIDWPFEQNTKQEKNND